MCETLCHMKRAICRIYSNSYMNFNQVVEWVLTWTGVTEVMHGRQSALVCMWDYELVFVLTWAIWWINIAVFLLLSEVFFSLLMVSTEITTTTKWFWLRSKFAWPNFKFGQFLLLCSFLKIHSISLAHSAGIVRLLLLWFFELTLWLNIQMLSQNTENIKKTGVSSEETRKMFYRWCNLVELVQSSLPNIF